MSQVTVPLAQPPYAALGSHVGAGGSHDTAARARALSGWSARPAALPRPRLDRHHAARRKASTLADADGGPGEDPQPSGATSKSLGKGDLGTSAYTTIQDVVREHMEQPQRSDDSKPSISLPPQPRLAAAVASTTTKRTDASSGAADGVQPLHSNGPASWDGSQTEDQLTEQAIRDGYSSKPSIQNEMNNARSALWPHLKGGACLASLSSAFVFALQQRQERDVFTSAPTFKPPPRVTLTDARKAAWLSELSDDSVPLRRLSRTIPHGLRGRVLLEQCLQSRIPIPRAMWLVKCVGANELRAFRRKGVSDATVVDNENKWVIEWTCHVERFLADPTRGHEMSYESYEYALRITSRIASEGLLDQEHFLDWLHGTLRSAALDAVPYVLLKIQCWLADILSDFKHAYWSANACLVRLDELMHESRHDVLRPLTDGLQKLALTFQRECPLSSLSFHADDLNRPTPPIHCDGFARDSRLSRINDSIVHSVRAQSMRLQAIASLTSDLDVYLLRDPSKLEEALDKHLASPNCDLNLIWTSLLGWAASSYRYGDSRVYACLRLLRALRRGTSDNDLAFVRALGEVATSRCISDGKLSHLIAEAVRSSCFDVGVYLRWLVSTGAMDGHKTTAKTHLTILQNIPTEGLSTGLLNLLSHVRNGQIRQRQTDESDLTSKVKQDAMRRVADAKSRGDWPGTNQSVGAFTDAPWPVKFSVSADIVQLARLTANERRPDSHPMIAEMLEILELVKDEMALATVIGSQIPFSGADMLKFLTEATTRHRYCLSAIAKLDALRVLLIRRYHNIKLIETPQKPVLDSLLMLARAAPKNEQLEAHLVEEIDQYDQRPGIAAQTPMSDNVPISESEVGETTFVDQVQRIFAKVSDGQSLCAAIVAATHVVYAEKVDTAQAASIVKSCTDRFFDGQFKLGDLPLMTELAGMYTDGREEAACSVLRFVLTFQILPFGSFLDQVDRACHTNLPGAFEVALDVLELVNNDVIPRDQRQAQHPPASSASRRAFGLHATLIVEQHTQALFFMITTLIDQSAGRSQRVAEKLATLCQSSFLSMLAEKVLLETEIDFKAHFERLIGPDMSDEPRVYFETLMTALMDPDGSGDLRTRSLLAVVDFALENVDSPSAPFHVACLPLLARLRSQEDIEVSKARSEILKSVHVSISQGKLLWTAILDVLPEPLNVSEDICRSAENALLAKHGFQISGDLVLKQSSSEFLLEIIRATARTRHARSASDFASPTLTILEALTTDAEDESAHPAVDADAAVHDLVHLILIHHGAAHPSDARPPHDALVPLLRTLCRMAPDPTAAAAAASTRRLAPATRLLVRAALAYFVLALPPAALAALSASLPARLAADPTLRFLLGAPPAAATAARFALRPAPPAPPSPLPPAPFAAVASPPGAPTPVLGAPPPPTGVPFVRSPWEMLPDAGAEDSSVGLRLFGARRVGA